MYCRRRSWTWHINPSVVASEVKFTYELPSQGQNGLDRELVTGANKEVFERWTEAFNCQYIDTGLALIDGAVEECPVGRLGHLRW